MNTSVLPQLSNTEETRSYKNIFKATTLFGGVQLYQIIINIIRSKFVAVLLGASGVGLQGLYQSVISLIRSITSLGLSQSAVRDVSEANGTGDLLTISKTVSTLRRLVWLTGLFGTIALICFSPLLSQLTFGNHDYTLPLIVLSCILLIDQLCSGQSVILQGMRRLKDLAKSSAIGSTAGLIVSVPLYYLLGIKGIVPTLILYSAINFLVSWLFARKIVLPRVHLSIDDTLKQGRMMIKMGVAMSASGILATLVTYILKSFIAREGGLTSVGLYQAGATIITVYVGMVFNALGTDFYPRLSAVNKDNDACSKIISQQGEIATHILAPLLCLCIIFMPLVLRILYSDQFLESGTYVLFCCPGMMFKLASWLIAFQFIAKAESVLFIVSETLSNIIFLALSIAGYKIWALNGLGIALSVNYLVYLIIVYVIAAKHFNFTFSSDCVKVMIVQFALILSSIVIVLLFPSPLKYWLCSIPVLASCLYSIVMLNKRIHLIEIIKDSIRSYKH